MVSQSDSPVDVSAVRAAHICEGHLATGVLELPVRNRHLRILAQTDAAQLKLLSEGRMGIIMKYIPNKQETKNTIQIFGKSPKPDKKPNTYY